MFINFNTNNQSQNMDPRTIWYLISYIEMYIVSMSIVKYILFNSTKNINLLN